MRVRISPVQALLASPGWHIHESNPRNLPPSPVAPICTTAKQFSWPTAA